MNWPAQIAIAVLVTLTLGCTSNPTPHPQTSDGATTTADTQTGNTNTPPETSADEAEALCNQLGGTYGDDKVCDLGLETAFDAAPSAVTSPDGPRADVTAVAVSGEAGSYTFDVTIASDETGCDSYADWWEVVTVDGALHYRRILTHSHVDEQPFTRSGGPVEVAEDDILIVRAHRHPEGYVGDVQIGTVASGFAAARLNQEFAATLDQTDPLPTGCAF